MEVWEEVQENQTSERGQTVAVVGLAWGAGGSHCGPRKLKSKPTPKGKGQGAEQHCPACCRLWRKHTCLDVQSPGEAGPQAVTVTAPGGGVEQWGGPGAEVGETALRM